MELKKRILVIGLLFLLAFPMVAASESSTSDKNFWKWLTGGDYSADGFSSFFSSILASLQTGAGNDLLTKILVLVIVCLFIFSLLDMTGIFGSGDEKKVFVLWMVSVAMGILSVFYMGKGMLGGIGNLYTAFGGALVTFLPFLVIMMFTIRAVKDGNVNLLLIQNFVWWFLTFFLLYVLISEGAFNLKDFFAILGKNIITFVFFLFSLAMALFNTFFIEILFKKLLNILNMLSVGDIAALQRGRKVLRTVGGVGSS